MTPGIFPEPSHQFEDLSSLEQRLFIAARALTARNNTARRTVDGISERGEWTQIGYGRGWLDARYSGVQDAHGRVLMEYLLITDTSVPIAFFYNVDGLYGAQLIGQNADAQAALKVVEDAVLNEPITARL